MEMNCQSILTNLGPFWYEAEIEAEALGISKENYNRLIETDSELPEKIMTIREYRKMSQLFEDALCENNLKEKMESASQDFFVPEYIGKLINAGLVFCDGKRVIGNLANVAKYLENDCRIQVTERFLQEVFLKSNGTMYSISACKDAMATIHTK